MKRTHLAFFLIIFYDMICAQVSGTWDWAKGVTEGDSWGVKTCVDRFGDVFILGSTQGAAASPSITPESGWYVARYDRNGQFTWSRHISGNPTTITCDMEGNLYVGGNHSISGLIGA